MSARTALVRGVLRANPGRTRLMVAAIAIGVGASGAILGAYTVIDRTIAEDFASTNPPAALITLAGDARGFVSAAAAVPGVTAAEARREVVVRMSDLAGAPDADGAPWQRLTLVAVDDAEHWADRARVRRERGMAARPRRDRHRARLAERGRPRGRRHLHR